ncbi:MAG TPA: hypothetical protein PKI71_10680, partial [Candidatus Rifleibacterium sp.]|nr:hypothetical protein [Candidatus Rifleibacterium sp.]
CLKCLSCEAVKAEVYHRPGLPSSRPFAPLRFTTRLFAVRMQPAIANFSTAEVAFFSIRDSRSNDG